MFDSPETLLEVKTNRKTPTRTRHTKSITIKIDKKVDTLTQLHQQPQPSTSNPNTANGKTFAQVIKNPNAGVYASKTYYHPKRTSKQHNSKAMQPNSISPKMIEANTKQIITKLAQIAKSLKYPQISPPVVIQSAETSQEKSLSSSIILTTID
ncbi:hypothetical protein SSS_04521 [Sarcoptes scabiei]|uniref:Uncharacterized protein n=1 Tax=Sarcoptes scabiei TaxID=52283 RepID=A0A834R4S1_SARSC|nr:hypothetical protein SSS_04521 [Sarcoptes scabiei]